MIGGINDFNKINKPSGIFIAWFVMLTISSLGQSNFRTRYKHGRTEFGITIEQAHREANRYFNNDTTDLSNDPLQNTPFKNNYAAVNFHWNKFFPKNWILKYEFRYKLWGFQDWFINTARKYPNGTYDHIGFYQRLFNVDMSISLMKRYMWRRWEARPRAGFSLFSPSIDRGFYDTTIYENDGYGTEFNLTYVGSDLKIGFNVGAEFCYHLSQRIDFTLSTNYYCPFNNTYNWHYGVRAKNSINTPWWKYKIKVDGFYVGLGVNIALKNYN